MFRKCSFALNFVLLTTAICHAQDRYATIRDCAVTLVGEFSSVRGIEATSSEQLAFLDTVDLPGIGPVQLSLPLSTGTVNNKTVTLGNFGSTVDFSGETSTSILYRGSQDTAASDLVVEVGISSGEIIRLPFVKSAGQDDAVCADLEPVDFSQIPIPGILGGLGTDERFATIVDGYVTLNGTFTGLAGIEAVSQNGYLKVDSVDVPGIGQVQLTRPYLNGVVVGDRNDAVIIGVLGPEYRIDIDRSVVQTSILYWPSEEVAKSDLTINVGLGNNGPASIPIGGVTGSSDGTFSVEDGVLTLEGTFSQLSGIEATSVGGYLSVAENLTAPFDSDDVIIVDETDGHSILIGVNTAAGRINLEGLTQTAIRYAASDEVARNDLVVQLGIAGLGGVPIQHTSVPEPTSAAGILIAFVGVMSIRPRRTA